MQNLLKAKIFLLLVICLTCAGCFQVESNLKITDSGAVTMQNKFIGAPLIAGIIEETKNDVLKNNPGAKIKAVTEGGFSGYEFEIFYPNMESFAANNFEMYQARPGKCTGIQISNGWFSNSYSFDFLIDGRKVEDYDLSESLAQMFLAQVKFDFMVEIPYAAESSNADFMSNDGKILKWNIAPALIGGQDKSVKLNFKIYNTTRIAATFFLALLVIAGVIYNLSQAKLGSREQGVGNRE
ncbi:MAG: hypothetical protein IJT73_11485 [Selenomonadaceae bacterium]|nr:hypothetical protein [Selenomonadaceae bacterium]